MDHLTADQQDAVRQLQNVLDSQNFDTDVLASVLQSVDWNVQVGAHRPHWTPNLISAECNGASSRWPSCRTKSSAPTKEDVVCGPHRSVTLRPARPSGGSWGESTPWHIMLLGYLRAFMKPPRSFTSTVLAFLSIPINVVTGILRFIFGVLRIPFLSFNFGSNLYRPPPRQTHDARGAIRRWINALEEETGAYNIKTSTSLATGLDSGPSTSRRHAYPPTNPENTRVLPDFFDGTYDELLDICQKEGRVACVVLVSEEHDDVPVFKRFVALACL